MINSDKEFLQRVIHNLDLPTINEIKINTGIDVLNTEIYIPERAELYKNRISIGAYILISQDLEKYVGESAAMSGLYYRLYQHQFSEHSPFFYKKMLCGYVYEIHDASAILREENKKLSRKLETYLINRTKPELNRLFPKIKK